MVVSSEENNLIESFARFKGLRELLEEDVAEVSPSDAEYSNVSSNHPAFKELYLQVRVVQEKYKGRFVPSVVTEEVFNEEASPYKYNDLWLEGVKTDFKRVNKAVVTFLDSRTSTESTNQEQKFNAIASEEVTKLVTKITQESGQITKTVDDTFVKLQSVTEINPNQSQVYSNMQQQLLGVIDEKIPAMINALRDVAGPPQQAAVKKVEADFSAFENQTKTQLYSLVHLIAEKTTFGSQSSASG